MAARRALVASIVLIVALCLGLLLWRVLAPGGWTVPKLVMFGAFAGTAPWTGLCAANAVIGFVRLMIPHSPGLLPRLEREALPRVAIVVTVRNEDMARVLPPLRRLLRDLGLSGVGEAFTPFILSDSNANLEAEESAAAATGVRYRRRSENTGYKAGNIMDFLDHHADGFDLMLTLDADSQMSAEAVLRLVRTIQADPSLAIVQHLAVGLPASSPFPRLFQFGMRAGMRIWATGQDWWQGKEGPYWGHNAMVRIAPFRAHCRLPLLPDGSHILSHDQVEAAALAGAGWGVRVLPNEEGSWEANPPALPEFLRRELRWLAGNFQYRHLLRAPGFQPMGRWQLFQAILMFAGTPLYLVFLLAAALAAATDHASPFPASSAFALNMAWLAALYSPKLLGYAEIALSPDKRSRYGGGAGFTCGAVAEFGFMLLLDAVSAVAKTKAMLHVGRTGWLPQNRDDRGVGWREATRLLWLQTVLGGVVFSCFAASGWVAVAWAAPLAGGLLTAIPFCVLTSDPRLGRWLRERQLASIPEEIAPQHAGPVSEDDLILQAPADRAAA